MTSLFEMTPAPEPPGSGHPGGSGARSRPGPQDPDDLLTDLNPSQRQAVTHQGAPLLVVAGAGSGKTRVLTRRIAYLLATGTARPGEILAITFTNKAAAEMKERVAAQVGGRARAMWVSTFHSLCVRILRAEAAHLPVKSGFTIYDAADSQRLVTIVANGLDLDTRRNSPRMLASAISNLKNELVTAEMARERAGSDTASDFDKLVAEVYQGYQQRLVAASAYDFDDLIMQTVLLLQAFPAVAEHYRRRFRHVLVDEYQDTNHAQYVLVRELVGGAAVRDGDGGVDDDGDDVAGAAAASDDEASLRAAARGEEPAMPPAELVVVGDADQSIYAFRGASIRNITEFEKDYPNARTVLLEQNYRSTQTILSAANSVIAKDRHRRHKSLWTDAGDGERIVGYVGDDEYDEARFIADEIDRLCDAGDITYGDVAVFYRTNAASRAIEDVFIRSGMPYRIVGGVRFYERKEIKDALAYLRVVANRADEVSLRRILNTPKRGIGDRAEHVVATYAEQERIGFAEALAAHADIPYLASRSANAIAGFVTLLDDLDEVVDSGGDPADVVTAVLERTGYRAELADSDDPQDASRLENLDQLVTVLREQAEGVMVAAQQATEAAQAARQDGDEEAERDVDGAENGESGGAGDGPGDGDAEPGVGDGEAGGEVGDGEAGGEIDDELPGADGTLGPRELLAAVLEQLSLVADADSVPDSTEGVVTLMTLHTAKGLEFPAVFLTGWEDGIFPHQRSLADEKQLAEERRLAYVGITRARRRLYVSRAVNRSAWGQQASNPASRFLDDIPETLVDWRRLPEPAPAFVDRRDDWPEEWSRFSEARSGGRAGSRYGSRSGRAAPVTASRFSSDSSRPRPNAPRRPPLTLVVGDKVSHDKYGLGTVKEVSGSGQTATAVIDFGSSGTVRLMLIGGVPMVKL